MSWFRVPQWCFAVHEHQPSAERARAWVYLLGAWHAGDDPSVREIRRVTGFGGGRADKLVDEVAEWARANGATLPVRLTRQGTGQERGTNGAATGHQTATFPHTSEADRGGIGAASGQDRGVSRARDLLSEREKREERGDTRAREPAKPSVPETLDELLGGEVAWSRPARALAVAGVTPDVLVRMTERDLSMVPGVAGAWRVIAEACKRAGFPLEPGTPDRTARREAPRETLPERPKPPPGSPQQPSEEWFEFLSRKEREIKAGIRDWKGNPIPKVAHG